MHRLKVLVVVLAAGLLVSACDDDNVGPSDLVNGTWSLVSLQEEGQPRVEVSDPARYTLQFEDDGSLGVKSDCNSCGGSYELDGSNLDLGPVTCTKVFCGDTSLDQAYSRGLEAAQSVSVNGSSMTISGDGVTLQFSR